MAFRKARRKADAFDMFGREIGPGSIVVFGDSMDLCFARVEKPNPHGTWKCLVITVSGRQPRDKEKIEYVPGHRLMRLPIDDKDMIFLMLSDFARSPLFDDIKMPEPDNA